MNGKANTFRRLAGHPLLISSFGCYIGIHNWTRWSEPLKRLRSDSEFFNEIVQERHCIHCNQYEKRLAK